MAEFGAASQIGDGFFGGCPMPGSWFFESGDNGSTDSSSSGVGDLSPDEYTEEFQMNSLRAALNARNFTEAVEVPSSEHVAEIVGRQGCKIKALRAKTSTYIKTPVRGEEPVFVVTGRAEDVAEAKREIECAAEHFTQIRASRRHSQGGAPAPGHVTAYVRVPLRVVGLVVGPKGGTIKRIQQDTHTYIITPSREREPVFEVTGLPQNVDAARREIEQHIYQRTGNMPITDQNASISNYDLQAAVAASAVSTMGATNRPNYGALAAGTHEVRRMEAVKELVRACEAINRGRASGEQDVINRATLAYNLALKQYQIAAEAQRAAARQLGVAPPPADLPLNALPGGLCSERTSPTPIGHPFSRKSPVQLFGQIDSVNYSVSSAPNSTRGSSPAATTAGSQNSLYRHGNQYNTWSNAVDESATDKIRASLDEVIDMFGGMSHCSSRDEGFASGDRLNSIGHNQKDPYHLISSIWTDLDTSGPQRDDGSHVSTV